MTEDPAPQPGSLSRSDLQDRAIRGTIWTALHTVVALPIAFGVNVLLARVLGVVDYGRLTFLTAVMTTVALVAAMGVDGALLQFGAKAHSRGETATVRHLLSATQGYRLLVAAPVTSLALLGIVRIDPLLLTLALVFGVIVPAALAGAPTCLGIENRSDRGAQIAMVGNLLTQAAVVGVLLTLGSAESVWIARLVVGSMVTLLALLVISKTYRCAVVRPTWPTRLPVGFWRFALPAGAAGIVGSFVTDRTEVFFLQALSTPVAVGIFAIAFGAAAHIYAPAQSFIGPLVPALAGLAAVDSGAVKSAFLRVTRTASAVAAFFMAVLLPPFAALLPVIYGEEYSAAREMLLVLGVVGAVSLVSVPFNAFLMARLGGGHLLRISMVALAVNLILAVALIPGWGAWGAVWANAGGVIVQAGLLTFSEARNLRIGAREVARSAMSLPVAALLVTVLWAIAQRLVAANAVLEAVILGSAGLGLFVFLSKSLHLGPTEADLLSVRRALPRPLLRLGGGAMLWVFSRSWRLRH